jgi:prolipoprotein diacylglyceryltransferase
LIVLSASAATALHALFEYAAIALGMLAYRRLNARAGQPGLASPGRFGVMVGLLISAALGNKAVHVAEHPELITQWLSGQWTIPGQSIVGGLLGGLLGVELAKAITGQKASTGDAMVLPLALGMAVGRIGCFLAGLHDDTYGVATGLPWGIDFGDGVLRHPTQLYDMAWVVLSAALLHHHRHRLKAVPGLQFKLYLAGYLAWRWAIDGLKPVPYIYPLGFSGIQWVCALALAFYLPLVARAWRQLPPPQS